MVRKTRASLSESAMVTFERHVLHPLDAVDWYDRTQEYRYHPNGSVIVVAVAGAAVAVGLGVLVGPGVLVGLVVMDRAEYAFSPIPGADAKGGNQPVPSLRRRQGASSPWPGPSRA